MSGSLAVLLVAAVPAIADPLGRAVNEREGWLADLFATHPPIAERIARLESIACRRDA